MTIVQSFLAWQEHAACREVGGDMWFPEPGQNVDRQVMMICKSCHVRFECLEYALANVAVFGAWGGMSERERRNHKRAS